MDQKTIRVEGIPTVIPLERVKDKLTIHFLRPRNGGGEIENIELYLGPPMHALITFEEAEAAQRVLNVKDHICTVNGDTFRLRVTSHSPVLDPDEVFLKVSMIVDCRKFPDGFIKSQCKPHKDIEFHFDMKEELCNVQGAYTKLLAFSNNILKTLGIEGTNRKENHRHHMDDNDNFTTGGAQNQKQQLSSSVLEAKCANQHSETGYGSGSESQSQRPMPRSQKDSMKPVEGDDIRALVKNPASEDTIDHLEDFSLVMDSDIYLYMQTFKKAEYQKILCRYNVEAVDVGSEGITMLYLQVGSQVTGDIGLLTQAHFELLSLYVELQTSLRKEQISKGEIKCDKHTLKTLPADLQKMCPLLLCHEDESQLYFIGNVVDVSQAKQYIQELQIMTPLKYPFATQEPLRSTSSMGRQRNNSGGLLEPKHYSPRQSRSSFTKIESKGEQKLAANFSIPKSHFSSFEQNEQVEEDVKLSEQRSPFGDQLRHADLPSRPKTSDFLASLSRISSSTTTSAMVRPPTDDVDVHQKYSKDGNGTKGITYPKKLDSLSIVDREKESHLLKSTRKSENTGPMKAYSSSSVSYSLAGLSLLDTTKTILDYKPSEARSTLKRSNSFSAPKSKESDSSDKPSKTVTAELKDHKRAKDHQTIDAEISVDSLIWGYLKDVYRSNIAEICRQCVLHISEKKETDITVLTLSAVDKSKLESAKQHIESLYHRESTNVGSHLFNYHQLGVEGPRDEILNEWCCVFQRCSDKIRVKKEKNKLRLLFPMEVRAKIIEEYNYFFEKQRKLQSLKIIGNNITNEEQAKEDSVKEGNSPLDAKYNYEDYDSQRTSLSHPDNSEALSSVSKGEPSKEREMMEGVVSSIQQLNTDYAENNWRLQPTDGRESENNLLALKTDIIPRNMDIESSKYSQQADISNPNTFSEQERTNPTNFVSEVQTYDRQTVDADTGNVAWAVPDKFQMLINYRKNDSEYTAYASELSPQSLPIGLFGSQQNYSSTKTVNEQAELTSTLGPGSQTKQAEYSSPTRKLECTMEDPKTKHQSGSPSGQQATQKDRAKKCDQCKKLHAYVFKNPCGHSLCTDCFSPSKTCRICLSFSMTNSESVIKGTMSVTTMAVSLDGYNHDPSFKIVYEIANGIQGPNYPNPGQPYEGGRFDAYLPDNKEGQKILQLLKKAFDEGHTFKIRSFGSTDRVTWNTIPHKTSIDGGKSKNGYPDVQYLKTVLKQLKDLHIE